MTAWLPTSVTDYNINQEIGVETFNMDINHNDTYTSNLSSVTQVQMTRGEEKDADDCQWYTTSANVVTFGLKGNISGVTMSVTVIGKM